MTSEGNRDLARLSVLVLEAMHDQAALIDRCLDRPLHGDFTVVRASPGTELWARIAREPPDAIVLDLAAYGLQVLDELRDCTHAPIIALTSLPDRELGFEAVRHGAQDYFIKSELTAELLQRTLIYAYERRRLERTLAEHLKLAAIGRLAGGIAHDFNNLLTAILGHTEIAALDTPPDSATARSLGEVTLAAKRAAQLTERLLAVGRRQLAQPVLLDLKASVALAVEHVRSSLPPGIQLHVELGRELCVARADPRHLQQALHQVVWNAVEATPHGGQVGIRVHRIALTEAERLRHPEVRPGVYGFVDVTDNGSGIDPTVRGRLFEPFATTKHDRPNRGLGLAACYSIVKQHGGHIWIDSAPGRGTTCSMGFPLLEQDARPGQEPDAELARGTERVLIVDDEPALAALMQHTLQQLGYAVLVATSAHEALAIHDGGREELDLLVTDVVMPEMTGLRLSEWFRADRPAMKVLFVSGYTQALTGPDGIVNDAVQLLQKPFTAQDFARQVRRALDTPIG